MKIEIETNLRRYKDFVQRKKCDRRRGEMLKIRLFSALSVNEMLRQS